MADKKISALTELIVPTDGDYLEVVDVSDTSMAATGTNKKITKLNLTTHDHNGQTINPDKVNYDIAYTNISPVEGDVWWNPSDHTLNIQPDIANATLQVGQEQWIRVVNKTGLTITDGTVVYINSAQGNRPTIQLADADAGSTSDIIGVVTSDILDNAEGYVTTNGIVRSFNTSTFAAGDSLYLSQTPGLLTNIAPSSPAFIVRVGYALNSTNNGSIYVNTSNHLASDVALGNDNTLSPTQKAVKDYITTTSSPIYHNHQAGIEGTPTITEGTAGNAGKFSVDTGTVWFYTDSSRHSLASHTISASGYLTPADNDTTYVCADRDTDAWVQITDITLIDYLRYVPYFIVYKRSGSNNLHHQIIELKAHGEEESAFQRTLATDRYGRESGIDVIAVDGSHHITVNSGVVWAATTRYSIPAVTSATRQFLCFSDDSVTSSLNPIVNNTQYDTGTGSGTLSTGQWVINWIFRGIEEQDHLYITLSDAFPSAEAAKAHTTISYLPELISSHAFLIGRIIVEQGQDISANNIESAFSNTFAATTSITDHGLLSGLADDDHTQYYNSARATIFQQTSAMSNYQATSLMSNYQQTSNTSAITSNAQHTSLMSNYAPIGATNHVVSFNGQSNQLTFNAGSNLSLSQGAGASASAFTFNVTGVVNDSQSSLFQHTSATSLITSNAFPTANSTNLVRTSQSSLFQQTSLMSNYAPIGATNQVASFNGQSGQITVNAGSNLSLSQGVGASASAFTFNVTGVVQTSQSSLFQHTSVTSAITSNAFPTANSTNLVNTSVSSLFQQTSATSNITSNAFPSANTTKFAGTGTSATNASITLNSNGLAISVAAPGGGGGAAIQGSGTYSQNTGTVQFANSNGITFGLSNNGVMTASVQAGAAAGIGAMANSETTYTSGTVRFLGAGAVTFASTTGNQFQISAPATSVLSALTNITIGTTGSTIGFSVAGAGGAGFTASSTIFGERYQWQSTSSSMGQNTIHFIPLNVETPVSASNIILPVAVTFSSSAASNGTVGHTMSYALYTRVASARQMLSTIMSSSFTLAGNFSSNVSCSYNVITSITASNGYATKQSNSAGVANTADIHGIREFRLPFNTSLSQGEYWLAIGNSSSNAGTAGNILRISHIGATSNVLQSMGVAIASNNANAFKDMGLGIYRTTSGAFPNTVSFTQIAQTNQLIPRIILVNETQ